MPNFEHKIVETYGVISEARGGWTRELNLVSWNGNEPKYDIRDWDEEKAKMSKGITFTREQLKSLRDILNSMDLDPDDAEE